MECTNEVEISNFIDSKKLKVSLKKFYSAVKASIFCKHQYMAEFNTGTNFGQTMVNMSKIAKKNSENHIKVVRNSKNQVKNHIILHFINASSCKVMTMRTAAVQPPILSKKK